MATLPQSVSYAEFIQDGFVSVSPLFDDNALLDIEQNLQRYIRDVLPGMPNTQVYFEDKRDASTLKQMQKMHEHDDYFKQLIHDSVVRRIAETLLQDDVVPINLQYFNKPAGVGQATPPHQDGYYFNLQPCEAVTGWLALDTVDEQNGCVHYVRGSHKAAQLRPHGYSGVLGFSQGITDFGTAADQRNEVACPGPAGTFLMHHAKTIHYAGANQSRTRSRRALGFIYYAKRAREDRAASSAYQISLAKRLREAEKI